MSSFSAKIFIDGGDPQETREANEILLKKLNQPVDGQTTNPTLIAKNLKKQRTKNKEQKTENREQRTKNTQPTTDNRQLITDNLQPTTYNPQPITQSQALDEYKRIIQEMSAIIPHGSISIQVFANLKTSGEEMLKQARERVKWIPNASIKIPCTFEGLKAAQIACREMPINITLAFSQSQAAAVYEATKGAKYPVFISPFVGRLDDRGENGMDVIANIIRLYNPPARLPAGTWPARLPAGTWPAGGSDHHVQVLTASVRNLEHHLYALYLKSDIITLPFKVFLEWESQNFKVPEKRYIYPDNNLKQIPYNEKIVLGQQWHEYDLYHPLTESGVERFYSDWMSLFNAKIKYQKVK